LESLGEHGTFVIALDDLHSADDDTIALTLALARRAQRLPMLLVLALRDPTESRSPALDEFLLRVESDGRCSWIDLGALEDRDVIDVITGLTGHPPAPAFLEDVIARTSHNPFLVFEVVRACIEAGLQLDEAGAIASTSSLPQSHNATVLGRFLPLGAPARQMARVASLLVELRLAHLPAIAVAASLSDSQARIEFDNLVLAGILRRRDNESFTFAHDLIRETLEGELGPAERQAMHAAIARVMESNLGNDVDLAEVAHHAAAAAIGPDAHAAELALSVGDRLIAAPASAAVWYGRASELAPSGSQIAGRADGRRAQALARSGDLLGASLAGRSALTLLEPGADRDYTLAALVQALIANGDAEQALSILDADLARNGASTRLRVWRASALALLERWSEAQQEIDLARQLPMAHAADRLLVLVGEAQISHGLGDSDREAMLTTSIEELAVEASPTAQLFAWRFCGYLAASSRFTSRARDLLERASDLRERYPALGGGAMIDSAAAIAAWADGQWDEALRLIEAVRPELEMTGEWIQVAHLAVAEVRIRVARGDFQRASTVTFPERDLPPPYAAMWTDAQATLAANTGAMEAALASVDRQLAELAPGTMMALALTASGARLAARSGDVDGAANRLASAIAMTRTCRAPFALLQVAVSRAEALGDEAAAREAVALADLLGCTFEKGRSLLALGRAATPALEPLSAAWHIFRRLEAEPWRQAAAAALRERGLPVPRLRRRDAEALTDAEQQVAELVRVGMRNRDIAARLSYSPRTVESYLTRIYRKLGVESRLALARVLDESRSS
jgi:DNA-binding CsgD family transcriptional regulator